jgi:hypothetical protein
MTNPAPLPRGFAFYPVFACFLGVLLFTGCGKQQPDAPQSQPTVTTNAAPSPVKEAAAPVPAEKVCFDCKGEGTVPCRAAKCVNGQTDCPEPCLKLSHGVWRHLDLPGYGPGELWQEFLNQGDGMGYQAWSQQHLGEVITHQNGVPVNIGKCKVCGGTTRVKCDVCQGTGKQTCPICNGKKSVPAALAPTDNPSPVK